MEITGARRLYLDAGWCGDEACACNYVQIIAEFEADHPDAPHWIVGPWHRVIWESQWFSVVDYYQNPELMDELRKEVGEACKKYGLVPDLYDSCIHNWKAE